MALEEAMLAEDGILNSQLGAEEVTNVNAHPDGLVDSTASYVDQEYYCQDQVRLLLLLLLFILCSIPSWLDESIHELRSA